MGNPKKSKKIKKMSKNVKNRQKWGFVSIYLQKLSFLTKKDPFLIKK